MALLSLEDRFWRNVSKSESTECWDWLACTDKDGYGTMRVGGRKVGKAHRISHELNKGPIPKALFVLHRCDNPKCVNPAHLFLGTNKDNSDDKVKKGRNHITLGILNGKAKLTADQVLTIKADSRTHKVIAKDYGVTQSAIDKIKAGLSWKHLEAAP